MMKVKETFVCHLESTVAFIGSKQECEEFRASSESCKRWAINDVEAYGFNCYCAGNDDGYENGRNDAED